MVQHVEVFIHQVATYHGTAVHTLINLYENNIELCRGIDKARMTGILSAVHRHGRSPQSLKLLMTLVKPKGVILQSVATLVVENLSTTALTLENIQH